MSKVDVIRAWKEEEYRFGLSIEERAVLPANPAGLVDLSDIELHGAAGGWTSFTCGNCTHWLTLRPCNLTVSCPV